MARCIIELGYEKQGRCKSHVPDDQPTYALDGSKQYYCAACIEEHRLPACPGCGRSESLSFEFQEEITYLCVKCAAVYLYNLFERGIDLRADYFA